MSWFNIHFALQWDEGENQRSKSEKTWELEQRWFNR